MPQDLADFGQRGSAAQHLRRQAVAELMRALGRRIDARSLEGVSDDAVDRTRARQNRGSGHAPARTHGGRHCAGRPCRRYAAIAAPTSTGNGEDGPGTAFASDGDLSGFPVQIVQLEKGHFARPQSQPRE